MKLDEFDRLIKAITYKRGYRLDAMIDPRSGYRTIKLGLLASVPNSGNPDEYVSVHQYEWFEADDLEKLTPMDMLYRIRDFILAFERHEHDEWFAVNGKKPFDPHADGDPADVARVALLGETYGRGSE